jgi:hypothetical protein
MKLSEKTITILKNFSNINQSIFIKSGNKIRTISILKNILAEAKIEEEFPVNFGIYDLTQFLNGLDLHKNAADLDFENEGYVLICEGKSKSKFFFSDENVIVTPPDKKIELKTNDICFEITTNQIDKLLKASKIYSLDDLSAIGENGVIRLVIRDKKNETSNNFSIIVGETDSNFIVNFKVENLKIITGSYEVVISKQNLSQFTSKDYDLTYFIALEPDSKFE